MDFQLKKYHRNISNEEMIEDIKQVANILNRNTVTIDEYNEHGKYHSATLKRRFGNWSKVLQVANIDLKGHIKISNEELIEDLRRVVKILNKNTMTKDEYNEKGKHASTTHETRFGSWNKALKIANIDLTVEMKISEEDLFQNILNVWEKLGRQPSRREMRRPLSKYSESPYINRFGTWYSALEKFIEYINDTANCNNEDPVVEVNEITDNNDFNDTIHLESNCSNQQNNIIIAKHRTKRDPNWRLRFLVMKRDDFKCQICGRSPANEAGVILHIDHIMPWDKGGETVLENLQTLCSICNIGKSNLV